MRVIAWAILSLVLYVLSFGPVHWLVQRANLSRDIIRIGYYPLEFLDDDLYDLVLLYADWWSPFLPETPPAAQPP